VVDVAGGPANHAKWGMEARISPTSLLSQQRSEKERM